MNKVKISIISSSVRKGRKSHRVSLFLRKYLEETWHADTELIDLSEYDFPLFNERLKYQDSPSGSVMDFAAKIKYSDGIIIVTPEYNGGYPASLKNVIDLLYNEWYHKPVAISTVSDGSFGGSQAITSLQFILWKMKALVAPATFPVPEVTEVFDDNGNPYPSKLSEKRLSAFINELFWCIKAKSLMENNHQ